MTETNSDMATQERQLRHPEPAHQAGLQRLRSFLPDRWSGYLKTAGTVGAAAASLGAAEQADAQTRNFAPAPSDKQEVREYRAPALDAQDQAILDSISENRRDQVAQDVEPTPQYQPEIVRPDRILGITATPLSPTESQFAELIRQNAQGASRIQFEAHFDTATTTFDSFISQYHIDSDSALGRRLRALFNDIEAYGRTTQQGNVGEQSVIFQADIVGDQTYVNISWGVETQFSLLQPQPEGPGYVTTDTIVTYFTNPDSQNPDQMRSSYLMSDAEDIAATTQWLPITNRNIEALRRAYPELIAHTFPSAATPTYMMAEFKFTDGGMELLNLVVEGTVFRPNRYVLEAVGGGGFNVRSTPSIPAENNSNVVRTVRPGEMVATPVVTQEGETLNQTHFDSVAGEDGHTWYKVQFVNTNGQIEEAFVRSDVVRVVERQMPVIALGALEVAQQLEAFSLDLSTQVNPEPTPIEPVVPSQENMVPEPTTPPGEVVTVADAGTVPNLNELSPGQIIDFAPINTRVEASFVSEHMIFLEPEVIANYDRANRIMDLEWLATPEATDRAMTRYLAVIYSELMQRNIPTQEGGSYSEALGVDRSATHEQIMEVLENKTGLWPLIPYKFNTGQGQVREGYANPNLKILVTALPETVLNPQLTNLNYPAWLSVPFFYGESGSLIAAMGNGVIVNQQTGQITIYFGTGLNESNTRHRGVWSGVFLTSLVAAQGSFLGEGLYEIGPTYAANGWPEWTNDFWSDLTPGQSQYTPYIGVYENNQPT